MAHTIEPAASGRARCRGCGRGIPKGELRLGVRLPNPFDEEKEMTLWLHLPCGAYARPDAYLEAVREADLTVPDRERLDAEAKRGSENERLTRLRAAERAPTGRASCRGCRESIPKGSWRLALVFYEDVEGRFSPAGSIHPRCAKEYFGTTDVLDRLRHFTPELGEGDVEEIRSEMVD